MVGCSQPTHSLFRAKNSGSERTMGFRSSPTTGSICTKYFLLEATLQHDIHTHTHTRYHMTITCLDHTCTHQILNLAGCCVSLKSIPIVKLELALGPRSLVPPVAFRLIPDCSCVSPMLTDPRGVSSMF